MPNAATRSILELSKRLREAACMMQRLGRLVVVLGLTSAACTTSADDGTTAGTGPATSTATPTTVESLPTTTANPTSPSTTGASTTEPPTTTAASIECGFAFGDNLRAHAGIDRNVLFVPAESDEPVPLLLLFHGFASIPALFAANTGLHIEASNAGIALAVPFGSGFPITWEQGGGPADDAGFITSVFNEFANDPCIDADNIWMAGYSAGAGFVGVFACSVADQLAGIVMNAAVAPPLCSNLSGFDVLVSHGTADLVVPYDGLTIDQPTGPITLPPSPELAAAWATNLACTADIGAASPTFEQERWTACGTEANTVDMLTYLDGGHRWPGRPSVGGEGLVVDEPDLTCVILSAINGAANAVANCPN